MPLFASIAAVAAGFGTFASGCGGPAGGDSPPLAVHLVDVFSADMVSNGPNLSGGKLPPLKWDFGGPADVPEADAADPNTTETETSEPASDSTTGPESGASSHDAPGAWTAASGIRNFRMEGGRLIGFATNNKPILHVDVDASDRPHETLRAIEIRMRAATMEIQVAFQGGEQPNLAELQGQNWPLRSPVIPDVNFQTVVIKPPAGTKASQVRHLFIQPATAPGPPFEIDSVRLIYGSEYTDQFRSGVTWQGLNEIYSETIVARAPERIAMDVTLPDRPVFTAHLATAVEGPVTFEVEAAPAGNPEAEPVVFRRTVTSPDRWEPVRFDLAPLAGQDATLTLSLQSEDEGAVGFWGAPVVREGLEPRKAESAAPPRHVILVLVDTLRPDHLNVYGYDRATAPNLARIAAEGTLFRNCIAQGTWTKVSVSSILTSLYPITHTVHDFDHRIPNAAETIAEQFRDEGYATLSMSSIMFTGKFTNLHQGFEQVHEFTSLKDVKRSKTAREYMDRLLPWIEHHRDEPFFVFLHLFDPHDPFEPHEPFDNLWADPARREQHLHDEERVKEIITNPLMKLFAMPSREELERAQIDPDRFISHNKDWYDGSIREMDAQLGRLIERLENLGIADDTLLVFTSDHGEEFLEHGRTFHGHTAYGELARVPLIFWSPGRVAEERDVEHVVESVDIMPTMLELAGLETPEAAQGDSLIPLVSTGGDPEAWTPRPAFTEKAITRHPMAPALNGNESFAVVLDGWKLIHNVQQDKSTPEFELYDAVKDPHDLKNVAEEHPEVVERLAAEIASWREAATAAMLPSDAAAAEDMTPEEIDRLRSLGYLN